MRRLHTARTGYKPPAGRDESGLQGTLRATQVLAYVAYELLPIPVHDLDRDRGRTTVGQRQFETREATELGRGEVGDIGPGRGAYAGALHESDPITGLVQPHDPRGLHGPGREHGERGDVGQHEE